MKTLPLMIVFSTTPASFGSVLRTVMALPKKLMFSKYSPSATITTSPGFAALIAS